MGVFSHYFLLALFILAGKLGITTDTLIFRVFGIIFPFAILFYAFTAYFALYGKSKLQRKYLKPLRTVAMVFSIFLIASFFAAILLICL